MRNLIREELCLTEEGFDLCGRFPGPQEPRPLPSFAKLLDRVAAEIGPSRVEPERKTRLEVGEASVEPRLDQRAVLLMCEHGLHHPVRTESPQFGLQGLVDGEVDRLSDASAGCGHVHHDDVLVLLLHPCAEGLADVDGPAIDQEDAGRIRREGQIHARLLKVRGEDLVDKVLHRRLACPMVLSVRKVPVDVVLHKDLGIPRLWEAALRLALENHLKRQEKAVGVHGHVHGKVALVVLALDLDNLGSLGSVRVVVPIHQLNGGLVCVHHHRWGKLVPGNQQSQTLHHVLDLGLPVVGQLLRRGRALAPRKAHPVAQKLADPLYRHPKHVGKSLRLRALDHAQKIHTVELQSGSCLRLLNLPSSPLQQFHGGLRKHTLPSTLLGDLWRKHSLERTVSGHCARGGGRCSHRPGWLEHADGSGSAAVAGERLELTPANEFLVPPAKRGLADASESRCFAKTTSRISKVAAVMAPHEVHSGALHLWTQLHIRDRGPRLRSRLGLQERRQQSLLHGCVDSRHKFAPFFWRFDPPFW